MAQDHPNRFETAQPPATIESVPRTPFFYGWVIVALAALCSFWGQGVIQRSYTVILKPLTEDLRISRTIGVFGVTLGWLFTDIVSPFIGHLIDRKGARFLVTVSAAATGLTLILLAQVDNPLIFLVLFGGVLGLARPSLQAVGAQTLVAKWFIRRRGRAVTFSTLGQPLSAIIIIPATEWMVAHYSWRTAWTVLGAGVLLLLTIPVGVFMRGSPESVGLLPDGDSAEDGSRGSAVRREPLPHPEFEWGTHEAVRTRTFWILSVAFAVIGLVPTVLSVHMFPFFTDQGLDPATAAAAAGSFGVSVLISRLLVWGFLLERVPIQYTLVMWGALMTAAISVMVLVHGPVMAFVAASCFGIAMGGTAPLGTLTWARYYGRGSLGSITGVANLLNIGTDIIGPLVPSLVFDMTGSYHGAFIGTALACVAGVALFAVAGPPRSR
ncbi:MAG: MFS transporter [Dehalococcoidia bacterium]|nr:MFS transporter [Dehalococcoidia bacterium]